MPDDANEGGVVLSEDETIALGLLLAARALEADEVVRDEVPGLTEEGRASLRQTILGTSMLVNAHLRGHEEWTGTNGREIHGRVS